jgi:hypothetical protein
MTRPEGAAESCDKRLVWLASYLSQVPILPPLQGGRFLDRHQGLKPLAESLGPFGTKTRTPVHIVDATSLQRLVLRTQH